MHTKKGIARREIPILKRGGVNNVPGKTRCYGSERGNSILLDIRTEHGGLGCSIDRNRQW